MYSHRIPKWVGPLTKKSKFSIHKGEGVQPRSSGCTDLKSLDLCKRFQYRRWRRGRWFWRNTVHRVCMDGRSLFHLVFFKFAQGDELKICVLIPILVFQFVPFLRTKCLCKPGRWNSEFVQQ